MYVIKYVYWYVYWYGIDNSVLHFNVSYDDTMVDKLLVSNTK